MRKAPELDDDADYTFVDLPGLAERGIWHDALDGIALPVREYYLTAMRAGQKLHDAPRIRLSTIHGVKGGEADNVVLFTDMAARSHAGFQRAPDDERRVFYVGVTRGNAVWRLPIMADGKIYCPNQEGSTFVVTASEPFEVIAENKLDEGCMASPAAYGGALYLRTKGHLYKIVKEP